jgi:hypothetical protein
MARKRIKSLDAHYMGEEPLWDENNPCPPFDAPDRGMIRMQGSRWYDYFYKSKDHIPIVLKYVKEELGYSDKDVATLKKLPPWKLGIHAGSWCRLFYRGWIYEDVYVERMKVKIAEYLVEAKRLEKILDEQKAKEPKKIVISPYERTRRKVLNTVAADWDEMVIDQWMEGEFDKKKVRFPVYSLFQLHGLKGSAINMFRDIVMEEYKNIKAAYERTDDQCIEAYAHIKKGNKRKMLDLMDGVFEDLERYREAQKARRSTRAKKVYSSTDQVKNLKYLVEDVDAKVHSINPTLVPKANILWMYNVKTRKLTEFKSNSMNGFEIRGSTLYKWDNGRITTLRKPDEILPQIINKTEKQIDNVWKSLTTKIGKPTGRINKDCILLRVE